MAKGLCAVSIKNKLGPSRTENSVGAIGWNVGDIGTSAREMRRKNLLRRHSPPKSALQGLASMHATDFHALNNG